MVSTETTTDHLYDFKPAYFTEYGFDIGAQTARDALAYDVNFLLDLLWGNAGATPNTVTDTGFRQRSKNGLRATGVADAHFTKHD